MALKFDITGAPPALTQITSEREHAAADRAILRKKNIRFLIFTIIMVVTFVCLELFVAVPAVRQNGTSPTFTTVIVLYTPYVTFFLFAVTNTLHHKIIEKPRKIMDATIAALKEATPEEIAAITDAKRQSIEISSYQERVTGEGRPLVRGEIEAMRRWLDKNKPRE